MRLLLLTCAMSVLLTGCSTVPSSETDRAALKIEVDGAIMKFKAKDPTLKSWFEEAKGYAVFPTIGKAGAVLGGSFGRGLVFKGGEQIGYVKVTEASVGLQLGGQHLRFDALVAAFVESALDDRGRLSIWPRNRR